MQVVYVKENLLHSRAEQICITLLACGKKTNYCCCPQDYFCITGSVHRPWVTWHIIFGFWNPVSDWCNIRWFVKYIISKNNSLWVVSRSRLVTTHQHNKANYHCDLLHNLCQNPAACSINLRHFMALVPSAAAIVLSGASLAGRSSSTCCWCFSFSTVTWSWNQFQGLLFSRPQ